MSIQAMSWVWDKSRATGSTLLVALAIADSANADGGGAFPSVQTIARKARLGVRATQTSIRSLEKLGELTTLYQEGPGGVNVYRVNMGGGAQLAPPEPEGAADATPHEDAPSGARAVTPEVHDDAPRTVPDPSGEPSSPPEHAHAHEGAAPEPDGPVGTNVPMPGEITWPAFVTVLRSIPRWDADDAKEQHLIDSCTARLDEYKPHWNQRERLAFAEQLASDLKAWWGDGTSAKVKGRKSPRDTYQAWFLKDVRKADAQPSRPTRAAVDTDPDHFAGGF